MAVERAVGTSNFSMDSVIPGGVSSKSNIHTNLEKRYKVPEFQHAYKKHTLNPLTAQYINEVHNFLVSHGTDKQLGPELWSSFVRGKTPDLMGFIFVNVDRNDFLWLCKFIGFIFSIDNMMDESEWKDNPDKSCPTILGMTLTLLWYNPDDERLLEHMNPLFESVTSDESRAHIQAFHDDLAHASKQSKNLLDIEMTPIASAFRELWIDYCEVVPSECFLREAYALQDNLIGFTSEANNRKAGHHVRNFDEYVALRRMTGGVLPFIICTDMLIGRSLKVSQIPNSLFYTQEMQNLLLTINDIISWHNDIFSFHKEFILGGDTHNIVKVLSQVHNCASYTEAGEIALQLLQDRIVDMERVYEQLRAVAPPEYHLAIDRYMTTCRDWISGTHQWHLISSRYDVVGTSV